jgi:hypothetical protein
MEFYSPVHGGAQQLSGSVARSQGVKSSWGTGGKGHRYNQGEPSAPRISVLQVESWMDRERFNVLKELN